MKKPVLLSVLIGLVLAAMLLPWAYLQAWRSGVPEYEMHYRPAFGLFAFGAGIGSVFTSLSFVLALVAFVLSFFSAKKPVCRRLCGSLLLASAAACICDGSFDCFTALTWGIFGTLILLGLWTLFFLRRVARGNSQTGTD